MVHNSHYPEMIQPFLLMVNILSEDVKEHFDDYPLIANESRSSEWCEVGIKNIF